MQSGNYYIKTIKICLFLTKNDNDFISIEKQPNIDGAYWLKVVRKFNIEPFIADIALVKWQLYEDDYIIDEENFETHYINKTVI